MPLAISDYEQTMDWMEAFIAADGRGYMTAAAVNLVMCALDDSGPPNQDGSRGDPSARNDEGRRGVRAAVLDATLAVPDGQPLVWALRLLGHRRATRVYGPDLMEKTCARCAQKGIPVYLYGGRSPEALRLLESRLRERFPGLPIAGGFSPPFRQLDAAEREQVAGEINRSGAQIVWVGTGQPKQELWMHRMRPLLAAPLLVGVGAAFDFHAGIVSQAPRWMRRAGLEWCYRLSREPRRLWRRYLTQNPRFIAAFARQWLGARRAPRA